MVVIDKSGSIPHKCPECGRKLRHVNAVDVCGLYFVYCMNLRCRWCEVFEFEGYVNVWSKP